MKAIWIAVISFMCATTSFAEKVDARNKAMEKRSVERKEQKQTVKKKRQRRAGVPQDVVDQYQPLEFQGMPYRFLPLEKPALDTKYPLILSLHGGAGRGTCNLANLRAWNKTFVDPEWREQYPCYVVAPQSSETWRVTGQEVPELTDELIASYPEVWQKTIKKNKDKRIAYNHSRETTGSLSLAVELVKDICERYPIDKDRIYVLGFSMGGYGCWNAAWGFPDFFAAAIPSSGGLAPWKDRSRFADLPIWAFHGDEDDRVAADYTREIFKTMQELGGNLKYTELKGVAHGAPQFALSYKGDDPNTGHSTKFASGKCDKTEDVWQWLFNQKRAR